MNLAIGRDETKSYVGYAQLLKTLCLVSIRPTDPMTFASIVVLFFAIAAVACGIPALRASGLDPMVALRND